LFYLRKRSHPHHYLLENHKLSNVRRKQRFLIRH